MSLTQLQGFIPGSRASLIMDCLVPAMAVTLVILIYSIFIVRRHKNYKHHKTIQLSCGIALAIAVILFEIDVRFFGWKEHAQVSPYFETTLFPTLYFHITWATLAAAAWIAQIYLALKKIGADMERSLDYSQLHRRLGWFSVISMSMTAVTGWIFYYMAFIAL